MKDRELPGFYFDREKNQYFRITGSAATGSQYTTPQRLLRNSAHRESLRRQEEIRRKNSVPIPQAVDLLRGAGSHRLRQRKRTFERCIMDSAIANMKAKFESVVDVLPVREATHCFSSDGIVTASYAVVNGGSAVISSRVNYPAGEATHSVANIHASHKIVDLKPLRINDGSFAMVACQSLQQSQPFISIRPTIQDRLLDDFSKAFEFHKRDTIWSVAGIPGHVAAGLEGRIDIISMESGQHRSIRMKENAFVLEKDGDTLFAGTNKGNILVIDGKSDKIEQTIRVGNSLSNLKVSEKYVIASAFNHTLQIFDRRNSEQALHTFEGHKNSSTPHLSLVLDESMGVVVSSSTDCVIRSWSTQDFSLMSSISDEKFIKHDAPPCILLEDSWSPPKVLTVLYGDNQVYYGMEIH